MMTTSKLHLRATVERRGEASAFISSPGDAVLVKRERPRLLILSCPCGCGEEYPINLDPRAGQAWRLYQKPSGSLTLFPSVWRDTGCKSHFIIWDDKVLMFGQGGDWLEYDYGPEETVSLKKDVYRYLLRGSFHSFSDIAFAVDAVPWDVLRICRQFAARGIAQEGRDKSRGTFRIVQSVDENTL